MSTTTVRVDPVALRAEVRDKYADVAVHPDGDHHFHTGRPLAARLGYDQDVTDRLPDEAVAAFAGVGNPFLGTPITPGDTVVDLGSGGGFDVLVAAHHTGPSGRVIGVDMTPAMIERSKRAAAAVGADNVEFHEAILEELPIADASVDVVISNGVLNLTADKHQVLSEASRVLRPGGVLQFADIAVQRAVPDSARSDIGLWTDCIAGGMSVDEWAAVIEGAGFDLRAIGLPVDAFGGARGERNARRFGVFGHVFIARKPS